MKQRETVVFLSDCAVDEDGKLDPFFAQELPWLQNRFTRVLAVGRFGTADVTAYNCKKAEPLWLRGGTMAAVLGCIRVPFTKEWWQECVRLIREKKAAPMNLLKLCAFAARGQRLHLWLERLLRTCAVSRTTLYSYWMNYDAYAAALSKRKHPQVRFLCRGHAFDIDTGRNPLNPYLMKRMIARQADGLFPIGRIAKEQYLSYMQGEVDEQKIAVIGPGSRGKEVKTPLRARRANEPLRLVSCANISEIKQLPLLIDALSQWDGTPLQWTHIGGGPDEAAARAYAAEKLGGKANVSYFFTGNLPNAAVERLYAEQPVDVFVNTSRMEGLPVSIMEAMRFGIPVIAPTVGGIPELVDDEVGILVEAQDGSDAVRAALMQFAAWQEERVLQARQAARERWKQRCELEPLLERLFATKKKKGA